MSPDDVDYTGDAVGSLPGFTNGVIDAGNTSLIDAGPFTVETRCCKLRFFIAAENEPSNAVATLKGEVKPLADGIPLVSVGDAGFMAAACFPVNSSAYYWYEFQWPTSDADAGGDALDDGGFWVHTQRYSATETNYAVGDGTRRNFIPAVNDCSVLDAGTGP